MPTALARGGDAAAQLARLQDRVRRLTDNIDRALAAPPRVLRPPQPPPSPIGGGTLSASSAAPHGVDTPSAPSGPGALSAGASPSFLLSQTPPAPPRPPPHPTSPPPQRQLFQSPPALDTAALAAARGAREPAAVPATFCGVRVSSSPAAEQPPSQWSGSSPDTAGAPWAGELPSPPQRRDLHSPRSGAEQAEELAATVPAVRRAPPPTGASPPPRSRRIAARNSLSSEAQRAGSAPSAPGNVPRLPSPASEPAVPLTPVASRPTPGSEDASPRRPPPASPEREHAVEPRPAPAAAAARPPLRQPPAAPPRAGRASSASPSPPYGGGDWRQAEGGATSPVAFRGRSASPDSSGCASNGGDEVAQLLRRAASDVARQKWDEAASKLGSLLLRGGSPPPSERNSGAPPGHSARHTPAHSDAGSPAPRQHAPPDSPELEAPQAPGLGLSAHVRGSAPPSSAGRSASGAGAGAAEAERSPLATPSQPPRAGPDLEPAAPAPAQPPVRRAGAAAGRAPPDPPPPRPPPLAPAGEGRGPGAAAAPPQHRPTSERHVDGGQSRLSGGAASVGYIVLGSSPGDDCIETVAESTDVGAEQPAFVEEYVIIPDDGSPHCEEAPPAHVPCLSRDTDGHRSSSARGSSTVNSIRHRTGPGGLRETSVCGALSAASERTRSDVSSPGCALLAAPGHAAGAPPPERVAPRRLDMSSPAASAGVPPRPPSRGSSHRPPSDAPAEDCATEPPAPGPAGAHRRPYGDCGWAQQPQQQASGRHGRPGGPRASPRTPTKSASFGPARSPKACTARALSDSALPRLRLMHRHGAPPAPVGDAEASATLSRFIHSAADQGLVPLGHEVGGPGGGDVPSPVADHRSQLPDSCSAGDAGWDTILPGLGGRRASGGSAWVPPPEHNPMSPGPRPEGCGATVSPHSSPAAAGRRVPRARRLSQQHDSPAPRQPPAEQRQQQQQQTEGVQRGPPRLAQPAAAQRREQQPQAPRHGSSRSVASQGHKPPREAGYDWAQDGVPPEQRRGSGKSDRRPIRRPPSTDQSKPQRAVEAAPVPARERRVRGEAPCTVQRDAMTRLPSGSADTAPVSAPPAASGAASRPPAAPSWSDSPAARPSGADRPMRRRPSAGGWTPREPPLLSGPPAPSGAATPPAGAHGRHDAPPSGPQAGLHREGAWGSAVRRGSAEQADPAHADRPGRRAPSPSPPPPLQPQLPSSQPPSRRGSPGCSPPLEAELRGASRSPDLLGGFLLDPGLATRAPRGAQHPSPRQQPGRWRQGSGAQPRRPGAPPVAHQESPPRPEIEAPIPTARCSPGAAQMWCSSPTAETADCRAHAMPSGRRHWSELDLVPIFGTDVALERAALAAVVGPSAVQPQHQGRQLRRAEASETETDPHPDWTPSQSPVRWRLAGGSDDGGLADTGGAAELQRALEEARRSSEERAAAAVGCVLQLAPACSPPRGCSPASAAGAEEAAAAESGGGPPEGTREEFSRQPSRLLTERPQGPLQERWQSQRAKAGRRGPPVHCLAVMSQVRLLSGTTAAAPGRRAPVAFPSGAVGVVCAVHEPSGTHTVAVQSGDGRAQLVSVPAHALEPVTAGAAAPAAPPPNNGGASGDCSPPLSPAGPQQPQQQQQPQRPAPLQPPASPGCPDAPATPKPSAGPSPSRPPQPEQYSDAEGAVTECSAEPEHGADTDGAGQAAPMENPLQLGAAFGPRVSPVAAAPAPPPPRREPSASPGSQAGSPATAAAVAQAVEGVWVQRDSTRKGPRRRWLRVRDGVLRWFSDEGLSDAMARATCAAPGAALLYPYGTFDGWAAPGLQRIVSTECSAAGLAWRRQRLQRRPSHAPGAEGPTDLSSERVSHAAQRLRTHPLMPSDSGLAPPARAGYRFVVATRDKDYDFTAETRQGFAALMCGISRESGAARELTAGRALWMLASHLLQQLKHSDAPIPGLRPEATYAQLLAAPAPPPRPPVHPGGSVASSPLTAAAPATAPGPSPSNTADGSSAGSGLSALAFSGSGLTPSPVVGSAPAPSPQPRVKLPTAGAGRGAGRGRGAAAAAEQGPRAPPPTSSVKTRAPPPGTEIVVRGLQRAPELNGSRGRVVGLSAENPGFVMVDVAGRGRVLMAPTNIAAPTAAAEWTCGACTLINPGSRTQCEACGGARPP